MHRVKIPRLSNVELCLTVICGSRITVAFQHADFICFQCSSLRVFFLIFGSVRQIKLVTRQLLGERK